MRLQPSRELLSAMYKRENEQLREMIKALLIDARPGWATQVTSNPDIYEFSSSNLWIRYTIDVNGETVILVTIVEQSSFM